MFLCPRNELFFKSFVGRQGAGKTSYITDGRNHNYYTHTHAQTEPSRSEDAPHADGGRTEEADGPVLSSLFTFFVLPKVPLCMLTAKQVKDFGSMSIVIVILPVPPNLHAKTHMYITDPFLMPHVKNAQKHDLRTFAN